MPKGKPKSSSSPDAAGTPETAKAAPALAVEFPAYKSTRTIGSIGLMETEKVEGSGKSVFICPATTQNLSGKKRLFGVVSDKRLGKGTISVEISLDGVNFSEAVASAPVSITGKGVAVAVLDLEDIKAPYYQARLVLDKAPDSPCAVAMQLCVSR